MPTKVFFKFKPGVSGGARSRALGLLRKEGATNVRKLFPGSSAEDLSGHYVAVGRTSAEASKLIDLLRSVDGVAFAHGDIKRRPM